MKGKKAVFCGDIGCYTLGNAKPLDMTDTCLCMGADVTMTQGIHRVEPDTVNFAFIGDSTFFASGMTGIVNAVYNQANMTLVVLDNSTTAMTGHQPHPGTGVTMMGDIVNKVSIEKILKAIGIETVVTADPLKLDTAIKVVQDVALQPGVKAIIFKSPCAAITKPQAPVVIDEKQCVNCKKCINDIGCPAIVLKDGRAYVEPSQCFGCKLCTYICPKNAIKGGAQ
jgi:indolepyruvate ferredoxin oxidoreductase alpha subunit